MLPPRSALLLLAAYALRPGSAAIGAGLVFPNLPAHDIAGRPIRVRDGRIDVGATGFDSP